MGGAAPLLALAWVSACAHGVAEVVVRQQRGELRLALPLRGGHQPAHLLAGRDPQRPDAGLRLRRIVGEGEHRDVGRARDRRDGGGLRRGQRPEDQPGAIGDRRLRGGGGTLRRAAGVLGVQRRRARPVERKLRRMQHRLADVGARARQRQQDRDALSGRTARGAPAAPMPSGTGDPP